MTCKERIVTHRAIRLGLRKNVITSSNFGTLSYYTVICLLTLPDTYYTESRDNALSTPA